MTKQTDTSAEAVERLREILSYGLPSHVEIQTGEGTSSPNAVFADADFEVGDGVCGLHASGRQANEPCIPYIRADALVHALAERDRYKARAYRSEGALSGVAANSTDKKARFIATEALAQIDAQEKLGGETE